MVGSIQIWGYNMAFRLWTIGKIDGEPNTWILPTRKMIERLREKIEALNSGLTTDIIWGPDLKCSVVSEEGLDAILIPVSQTENGETLYRLDPLSSEEHKSKVIK